MIQDAARMTRPDRGDSPLRQALSRLAARDLPEGECAQAPARDFAALIEALAVEVEETVLPRCFVLCGAGGEAAATLTISNRRLVALDLAGGAGGGPMPEIAGGAEAAAVFLRRLRGLWDRAGALTLRRRGRAEGFAVHELSCSAEDLRRVLSGPGGAGDRIAGFLAAARPLARAWLLLDGSGTPAQRGGDADAAAALVLLAEDWARQQAGRGAALRGPAGQPACTILAFGPEHRLFMAEERERLVLVAVPNGAGERMMRGWREMFGA